MVFTASVLAIIFTVGLFVSLLVVALLGAERRRQIDIDRLERQVADLDRRLASPATRAARERTRRQTLSHLRRAHEVFSD